MADFDRENPLSHDVKSKDPDLSHITYDDYEHVYEPSEDSFMVMEAFERDLNVMRFLLPRAPTLLEVGPGSGILSTYLKLLLKRATPLSCAPLTFSDHDAVCSHCHGLTPFRPLSLAADLNPTAATFSHITMTLHEPADAAEPSAAQSATAHGPCPPVAGMDQLASSSLSESAVSSGTSRLALATAAVHVGPETHVRAPNDVRVSDLLASFPPPSYLMLEHAKTLTPPVDVLVFNPPYVPSSAAEAEHPDVYVRSYAGGLRGRAVLDKLVPTLRPYLARAESVGAVGRSLLCDGAVAPFPSNSPWRRCAALLPVLSSLFYLVVMLPYNDIPSLLPFIHAHTGGLAAHVAVARQEGIETLSVLRCADPRFLRARLPPELLTSAGKTDSKAAPSALPQRLGLRFPVLARRLSAVPAASSTAQSSPPLMSECMHWGLSCACYLSTVKELAKVHAHAEAEQHSEGEGAGAEDKSWCACPCPNCDAPVRAIATKGFGLGALSYTDQMPSGWEVYGVFVAFSEDGSAADFALLSPHATAASGAASSVTNEMVRVSLDGRCTHLSSWSGPSPEPLSEPSLASARPDAPAARGEGAEEPRGAVTADDGDKTSNPYVNNSGVAGGSSLVLRAAPAVAAAKSSAEAETHNRPVGSAAYVVRMTPRDDPPPIDPAFALSFKFRAGASAGTENGAVCRCRWVHPGEDKELAEAAVEAAKRAAEPAEASGPATAPEPAEGTAQVDAEELSSDDSDDDAGAGFSLMFM